MSASNQLANKQLKAAYELFLANPAIAMHADFLQTLVQQLMNKHAPLVEKNRELVNNDNNIESTEKIIKDLIAACQCSSLLYPLEELEACLFASSCREPQLHMFN